MSAENEHVVGRFFDEVCNGRQSDVADELFADDYVSHIPQSPPAEGPAGVKETVAIYQDALDGRIAEEWTVWDALGLLQQIGAVPAPAPA